MLIRTSPQLGFTQSGTVTPALEQIKQFLNEHRTTLYIVAGAMLLLALMRRR